MIIFEVIFAKEILEHIQCFQRKLSIQEYLRGQLITDMVMEAANCAPAHPAKQMLLGLPLL